MAAMEHALITLEELGAISGTGEVTPLGQHLVCYFETQWDT